MILLQLSAAQGPLECSLAVKFALKKLMQEAEKLKLSVDILETVPDKQQTVKSVLVALEGKGCEQFAQQWQGSFLWIQPSPFRLGHKRKNWFFGGEIFKQETLIKDNALRFETMRAGGPGGQHVNKTESAIRATHIASGISVKVSSQRSQHANKKLAIVLISQKLAQIQSDKKAENKAERRMFHHQIDRGNAKRVFRGEKFLE